MNGFDLSQLSPEDIQQLTIHCIQSNEELKEIVKNQQERIQWLDEHVDSLEKMVIDDIMGGIDELYKENMHSMAIDGLKTKYGELFDPHLELMKEFYPDKDLYEELLKEREGFEDDEEGYDGKVRGIAEMLTAKFGKLRGPSVKEEAKLEGEPVEVEIKEKDTGKEEGTGEPESPAADITEIIKKMKGQKSF